MGLFSKPRMGKLRAVVEYTTRYNFPMTVAIREMKPQEPITFDVKVFEVPAETLPVTIRVVSGEVPIVGLEVLIREVDPNFKVTRFA